MKRFAVVMSVAALTFESACASPVVVPPGQPIVGDGLTVYYSFDDIGDAVSDGSGNLFHGTVYGSIEEIEGMRDGAAFFINSPAAPLEEVAVVDITNYERLDAAGNEHLVPRHNGISFSTWVYTPAIGVGDQSLLQARSNQGSFVHHFQIQNDGRIRFTIRGDAQSDSLVHIQRFIDGDESGTPVPLDDWYHVGMTYNNDITSDGFGIVRMYFNGEIIHEELVESTLPIGNWRGCPPGELVGRCDQSDVDNFNSGIWPAVTSGALIGATADGGARRLQSALDEYYIFHRAIREDEMWGLYQSEMAATADSPGHRGGLFDRRRRCGISILALGNRWRRHGRRSQP